ncbi:hypothetical protein D3C87_914640 [compost metagenome]
MKDGAVIGVVGADNQLCALPGRGELRRARFVQHGLHASVDGVHRLFDRSDVLLRRQHLQAGIGGQFDIDAQAIGVAASLFNQCRIGFGNGLEMDVPAKLMLFTQQLRHPHQLLHGVVRRTNDAGTEKQPADAVTPVEIHGQRHDFLGGETSARNIAGAAVDAVLAIVKAEIGQQNLQQRHAAPVRRVAVADAHAICRAQPALAFGAALGRAAARAGGVVLGGVGEDAQLVDDLHGAGSILFAYTV